MHLYHSPGSCSTRVLWTLEEVGAPYEVTIPTRDERRGGVHRTRHSLGRVPVPELDDGRLMFESAAICIQLADIYPEARIAPALGDLDRPYLYQWVFFAMTELESAAPLAHYGAAKAALNAYTRALAQELAPERIRVNNVTPGPVITPGGDQIRDVFIEAMGITTEQFFANTPLGRGGRPQEIAEAVAFLASDRGRWVTGHNYFVDGGQGAF